MKLLKTWAIVLAGAVGSLASGCAQTLPTQYQRAGTYPAELQMMRRLIEIAEGPPPPLAALEVEFGFTYQKARNFSDAIQGYDAAGSLPFNPGLSSGHTFLPRGVTGPNHFVTFKFAEQGTLNAAKRPFCLSQVDMSAELTQRNWQLQKTIDPLHGIRNEAFHLRSDGYVRSVRFFPIRIDCVKGIEMDFIEIVKPPQPSPLPP